MDPTQFPPGLYAENMPRLGIDLTNGFTAPRSDPIGRENGVLKLNQSQYDPCGVYNHEGKPVLFGASKPVFSTSTDDSDDQGSVLKFEKEDLTYGLNKIDADLLESVNGPHRTPDIEPKCSEELEKLEFFTSEGSETKPDLIVCDSKEDVKNVGDPPPNLGDFVKVETSEVLYCRFCAVPTSSCINIFETEGMALNLYNKITKCLPIFLSSDDQLPNTLCYPCLEKIEFVFSFSEQVYHSHRALIEHLDICKPTSANYEQVLESYFEGSNFFTKNSRFMKREKITDWEQDSGEESIQEEPEEAPKKRGRKKKVNNKTKSKKRDSKPLGSKKQWKKERMKVKLRFTPSLTTCASCGHRSETSKENLEHWDLEHKDTNIEYR